MISVAYSSPAYSADLSARTVALDFEETLAGDGPARIALDLRNLPLATYLYDRPSLPTITISAVGERLYRGRCEEALLTSDGGVILTAYGGWRALQDIPYTALWSDTSVGAWREVLETEGAGWSPKRYSFDTNNRIFISPNKGDIHGGAVGARNIGGMAYYAPDQGSRVPTNITFDYATVFPSADWFLQVAWYSAAPAGATWTAIGAANVIAGSGSGSFSQTFTGSPVAIEIRVAPLFNPGVALTQESGTQYARVTNVRVTSQAAPIRLTDIAGHMASTASAVNNDQIRASAARIAALATDFTDVLYADASMATALQQLAARVGYDAGVDRDGYLYLQPAGTNARTLYADIDRIEITKLLQAVQNSVYATYQEAGGRTLRTAAATNAASIARWGVTRRQALQVQTTSLTLAQALRDTALSDTADPSPQAAIDPRRILIAGGSPARPWDVRAGDTLVLRNLPAGLGTAIDEVRSFRVARRSLKLARGERPVLAIEPDVPPDQLAIVLANLQREIS